MSQRRLITVMVLAVWMVAGPVAMAVTGCPLMGGTYEALCGVFSSVV